MDNSSLFHTKMKGECKITFESKVDACYDVIPYTGMRKIIGDNMSRSWTIAPKVTHHASADVSELLEQIKRSYRPIVRNIFGG